MTETPYSGRELEILFKRIDEKLDDIKTDIKDIKQDFDKRITKVEEEVSSLKDKIADIDGVKTKILAAWSVIIVFLSYLLNRFL